MINNFNLNNFSYYIICDDETSDSKIRFDFSANSMDVFLSAEKDRPEFVEFSWKFESNSFLYVMGDAWERSYGNLEFKKIEENDRFMPWYFAATDKKTSFCFGVKTQPNSFVSFRYTKDGILAKADCRNGGDGVHLNGREIKLCTFIFEYYDMPAFDSLCDFCKKMCDNPILPTEKIYGGNNWYYAYGKSSREEMLSDSKLQAELAEGISNRPFMVIDDGWSVKSTRGPYVPNEKYGDMQTLCSEMKEVGVRPGIWVRLTNYDSPEITDDMKILRSGKREYLDPTNKKVQELFINEITKIRNWGYELIKHDFSTCDLFGDWGKDLNDGITKADNWHFEDETKTNAEIVLDFYRLIREQCGDMYIIGCNTVSHLCAGLVHINRTGDDTSGREWERTKKMGVNTLAFRLCQNNSFYVVDADCVGILDDNIPWEKNRQWLRVLSLSDTALFTSCATLKEQEKDDIAEAYREIQKNHRIEPADFCENALPEKWIVNDKTEVFAW